MSQSHVSRTMPSPSARNGFTLVELLVVIGIIAVLIGILLPALNKARRAGYTIKCASNMKQIALAVIQYTNDNKGKMMPCYIQAGGTTYPKGWWFSAELVRRKYLVAPNIHAATGFKPVSDLGVFQCPETVSPGDFTPPRGTLDVYNYGNYPTDAVNNNWTYGVDDGELCVGTTYILNNRSTGQASNYALDNGQANAATFNAPYMSFVTTADAATGLSMDQNIKDPRYQRTQSMVRHAGEFVMLVESSTVNFIYQNPVSALGSTHYASRLGARHGQKTLDKSNAWTNFAYMDGHVALVETAPIDKEPPPAAQPNISGMSARTLSTGTIFTFFQSNKG